MKFEAEADCRTTDSFGDKENATPANTPKRQPVNAIVAMAEAGSITVKVRDGI